MAFAESMLVEFWHTVFEMSPYLLFGFFVAGILSILVSQKMVERHLGGRGILPVLKATILGIPLPLCSCGVIPVSMSLRKHGAGKGATIAFLISTPETGVDSILVTYGLLGPVFAVFRPLVAFVTGMVGGILVDVADGRRGQEARDSKPCSDHCCTAAGLPDRLWGGLRYGFITLPRDIGKPLFI